MCKKAFFFKIFIFALNMYCYWKTICPLQEKQIVFGLKPYFFYVNIQWNWKFASLLQLPFSQGMIHFFQRAWEE